MKPKHQGEIALRFYLNKKIFILYITITINLLHITAYAVCPPAGFGIIADGIIVNETGCTIETNVAGRHGIQASNGANVTFSNGSILTTADLTDGINAQGTNTEVTVNDSAIETTGESSFGVNVNNLLGGNARVLLNNSGIITEGNFSRGLSIQGGGQIIINNSTVDVFGLNSVGAFVGTGGGVITIENGSVITTTQPFSFGAWASAANAEIVVDDSQIITNGANAAGARASGGGNVTFENGSSVITHGNFADGLLAQTDSSITANDSSIETTGASAMGAFAVNGAQIDLTGSVITTHGADANALYSDTNTGLTNTINATNTILNSDQAASIYVNQGATNINLNRVQNSSGTNQFLIVSSADVSTHPAHLNLIADDSTLTGDIFVAEGNEANITFQNHTTYTGATDAATANFNIGSSSIWNLTGDSTVHNLNQAGNIIFAFPESGSYKSLTIDGDYVGLGGRITLNTDLEGDNSPSDVVNINGGNAAGTTYLTIHNTFGDGALTQGNGILVVDATNGATTTANAFSLSGPVVAGPFEYDLHRGGIGGNEPDDWYLRSTISVPTPVDPGAIPDLTHPGFVLAPNFRREDSLYTALPSVLLLYDRMLLSDTLHKRVGEEEQLKGRTDIAKNPYANGVWVRVLGQQGDRDNGNIFHNGPDFNYDFYGIQPGIDLYHKEHTNGSQDFVGIYTIFGYGTSDVFNFLNINAGNNRFNAYTGAAYWTHFGALGWYLDGVIDDTYQNVNSVSNRHPFFLQTNGNGVGASLEGGYPFKLSHNYTLEPEAQVIYQTLSLNNAHDAAVKVRFDNSDAFAGRVGGRFTKTWALPDHTNSPTRLITAWLMANVWHEFAGDSTTRFKTQIAYIPLGSTIQGSWLELGVGASAQVTNYISFYATVAEETLFAGGDGHSYDGRLGIRVNF